MIKYQPEAQKIKGYKLWEASENFKKNCNISRFISWLKIRKGLKLEDYDALWQWSVDDIEVFWTAIWEYFEVVSDNPYVQVLTSSDMPGARWFPGVRLNFAEHILRNVRPNATALHAYSELNEPRQVSWEDLDKQVRILAHQLLLMGIKPGDRIVSYMPNIPEAVVVMLASTSIGAIFSSCSPDFGHKSVIDRFSQIEPRVLFSVDGYRFGGKDFDRRREVEEIVKSLPSLDKVVYFPYLFKDKEYQFTSDNSLLWHQVMDNIPISHEEFIFERVEFSHPLWILYSSGTTGLPKPIVHSHGGITLEMLKVLSFHFNLHNEATIFFYTTTGWMMWNLIISAMITGAAVVLYEGSPIGEKPDILWSLAEHSKTTFFGASPTYISMMKNQGIVPRESFNLEKLEGILLGGSPSTPEIMKWCYDNVKQDFWVTSQSGGTDICSAFVGASPTLPVYAGEIQARCLGVDAHAYNEDGQSVINEIGELVIRQPMPSMPIFFWNDNKNARYIESYFEQFPKVWCHGDYFLINERGGCFIYGRSDSTLNRYGVRIGTAEIYRSVEKLDVIEDSIVVNIDLNDGKFFMPLFVKLKGGLHLNNEIRKRICENLMNEYSPRHVPDEIIQVDMIPYTLTNKKMEVPLRKILMGLDISKAANKDAMANPSALDYFIKYANIIHSRVNKNS